MKKVFASLIYVMIAGLGTATAFSQTDGQIQGALSDIGKYEKQFKDKTTFSASSVKRTLKLLTLTRQRLDSSPNKTSPSWKEVDTRYNTLVAYLNGLLEPKNSVVKAPGQAGKPSTAQKPVVSAPHTGNRKMISQQRVRIKKLNRDILSAMDTLDKGGPKPFQDSGYVNKKQHLVETFKAALGKYDNYSDDPDVIATKQSLEKMENMMTFGRNHAAKEIKVLGNVQKRLGAINSQVHNMRVPAAPQYPLKQGDLSRWLVALSTLRQNAVKLYAPLPQIKQRAYLPHTLRTVGQGGAYDLQDVDRLERSLSRIANEIDQNLKTFSSNLELNLKEVTETLSFYDTFDPSDSQHFLWEGRAEKIRADLSSKMTLVSEAAEFDRLLKRPTQKDKLRLLERVKSTAAAYEKKYQQARKMAKMPKPATSDSQLEKIARQTLTNPKYDYVGEIKRLVINTEKVHREKDTGTVNFDKVDVRLGGNVKLSGTQTMYHYAWDEFQVATAEPVGDKYYVFYTTLKYFTSGSGTTPLNKWIIGKRVKWNEIPEENIMKD
jgi:hypothetical protein